MSAIARMAIHAYDIFEGTEQIQQLVVARAISGMRIEQVDCSLCDPSRS